MGDGLFNKFKILIGVEDAEEEREVQTVSAAPVAVSYTHLPSAIIFSRGENWRPWWSSMR